MAFIHTFRDTYPPARMDAVAWTRILVEESANGITGWAQIADQAIAVDPTPATPNPIDVTVTASLERAWFRFRFKDAALALSPYTTAVYSPNLNPLTLEGLKRRLDYEESGDDDKLQEYLDAAFAQAQAPHPHGCGRLLTMDASPRTLPVRRGRIIVPDASAITSVTVAGTAVDAGDYTLLRKDGYVIQISGLDPSRTLDADAEAVIAGTFGFTSIPSNLADGIYVLAARMRYEEGAMYADNVAVLEGEAAKVYYRQLPLRAKLVFATYAPPTGIVGLT